MHDIRIPYGSRSYNSNDAQCQLPSTYGSNVIRCDPFNRGGQLRVNRIRRRTVRTPACHFPVSGCCGARGWDEYFAGTPVGLAIARGGADAWMRVSTITADESSKPCSP